VRESLGRFRSALRVLVTFGLASLVTAARGHEWATGAEEGR